MSTINTARSERRTRLKVVISEQSETHAILRILQSRRAGRIARARRRAHHAEEERWTDIDGALAGGSTGNPANLLEACRLGKIGHHFRHKGRWWWTKPVRRDVLQRATIFEKRLIGGDGSELENGQQWQFQIHKSDWCEYLDRTATAAASTDAPAADVPAGITETVRLRPAPETEVRSAILAEYDEAEKARRKPPNINEVQAPVQERLKAKGYRTSGRKIAKIASKEEFDNHRLPPGQTWKTQHER
jgi:hypothetical protein